MLTGIIKTPNIRLDLALSQLTDLSRHHIKQLIDDGYVLINGKKITKPAFKTEVDQNFEIDLEAYQKQQKTYEFASSNHKLDVVYEDDEIAVINKTAGQVVHPAPGHAEGTLSQQLEAYFQNKLSTFSNRPGIVHRLDKDTSGLMVIAKTDHAHNYLQQQFASKNITKAYIAKVENHEKLPEHFWLECKVGPHPTKHQLMFAFKQKMFLAHEKSKHVDFDESKAEVILKDIETMNFTTAEEGEQTQYKHALLECVKKNDHLICYPHTGRQHQIRVQLKAFGHSIIGDPFYGKTPANRMMLHACMLIFTHPTKAKQIQIIQPIELFQ